jgi:Zn-dependent peptidase ImmA (M78 family)
MDLRRGFKTLANKHASEYRNKLNIAPHGPLCPWRLARHIGIPVFCLSEFIDKDSDANYFLSKKGLYEFSGGTFSLHEKTLIVLNDGHEKPRQASDLSHELSHIILKHKPSRQIDSSGLRKYDQSNEDEANWLGPALLVSEEAALHVVRNGYSVSEAAKIYSVTQEVMRMRLGVTGAFKRIRAAE